MDLLDRPLTEKDKSLIEYLKAFGLVLAINICTRWAASGIVLATKGWYDIMTVSNIGSGRIRTYISYVLTEILYLIVSVIFVNSKRSQFSWGDRNEEWKNVRRDYCRRHLIAHLVYSLPGDIFYLIVGTDAVYYPAKISSGMQLLNVGNEPWWLSFFFSPQTAFFRITESVPLGIILGVFYYAVVMIYACYRDRKPSKKHNTPASAGEATGTES